MKNQIIKTPTKGKEYFGFTDTDLVVSNKKHKEIDSLIGSIKKKGMLERISHIPISNILNLKYNEKNSLLTIRHLKKSKEKKFKIAFNDPETRNSIASEISQLKELSKSFEPERKIKPLLINSFFTAIALVIVVALTGVAYEAANGGEIPEFSGRRSGIQNLLVSISTALGPIGFGIIGGLGIFYMAWRIFKRWQNPANEIIFS